jgi:hypothetical protein
MNWLDGVLRIISPIAAGAAVFIAFFNLAFEPVVSGKPLLGASIGFCATFLAAAAYRGMRS